MEGAENPNFKLVETRRDEAIALLQMSQTRRNVEERVATVLTGVTSIAGSFAVAVNSLNALVPLSPIYLLTLAYMFQEYADMTVIAAARRRLEDLVNTEVGGLGLIYEAVVSPIRSVPPLFRSIRMFQMWIGLIVNLVTVVAIVVVIRDHNALVIASFGVALLLALATCFYSYLHLLKSGQIAKERLSELGLGERCAVWIKNDLYWEARDRAFGDELENETFERLIKHGLLQG
ncbi:MAG: hypothetical protein ACTHLH_11800 [Solirubrobacterales bacterium]